MSLTISRDSGAGAYVQPSLSGAVGSEVGAVMMVGGDIEGLTRVMTTAIVLETRKGNFELAVALGALLLGMSFVVNLVLQNLQRGVYGSAA